MFRPLTCKGRSFNVMETLQGEPAVATPSFLLTAIVGKLDAWGFCRHLATLEERPAEVQSCGTRPFKTTLSKLLYERIKRFIIFKIFFFY